MSPSDEVKILEGHRKGGVRGEGRRDFLCEDPLYGCDAKIYVQQKCLTFRGIGAKFVIYDDLGLQLIQKEAQSLTFKNFKMANIFFFSIFPHINNVNFGKKGVIVSIR